MPVAFVTGATGFVGLNLVPMLLERGWRVIALHRKGSDLTWLSRIEHPQLSRTVGDLTDADSIAGALPPETDALFHVAANVNLWSGRNVHQTRDNVEGTRNVAAAALERHVRRMVHVSSIAAYGVHDDPVDETTPSNARDSWVNYLRTKALAEDEVRKAIERGLDAVIVNPANIVGPFDLRNWSSMFRKIDHGQLPGAPPGSGSFCHVREVCAALIAAYEHGRAGENYLLGGVDARYLEMVQEIGRLLDRPVPHRASPGWLLRMIGRVGAIQGAITGRHPHLTPEMAFLVTKNLRCRSDKAIRELGFKPVPLREMLEDCHRWMVAEDRYGRHR